MVYRCDCGAWWPGMPHRMAIVKKGVCRACANKQTKPAPIPDDILSKVTAAPRDNRLLNKLRSQK